MFNKDEVNFFLAEINHFFCLKFQMNADFIFHNNFRFFINDFELNGFNIIYLKHYFISLFH